MAHNQEKVNITLKKATTLLNKITTMVDENRYCIDIIQQNLAVIGLLKSANLQLLEGHMNHCVKDALTAQDTERVDTMMEELLKVVKTAQSK